MDSLCSLSLSLSVICGNKGKVCPVTAYDKDGIRVLLHFATDCPSGRPDVLVIVVSMLNTAPLPVSNIVLQAAVPKVKGLALDLHSISTVTNHVETHRNDALRISMSPPCSPSPLSSVDEGEAAAAVGCGAGGVQPHPAPRRHHSGHAAGQSAEGMRVVSHRRGPKREQEAVSCCL